MCYPALIGLAISAVSAGVSYSEGNKSAKRQEQAMQSSAEMENIQTSQLYEQQNQAAMDESSQRHIEWLRELGRMKTAGAETGLMGATENRLERESEATAQRDIATIEANRLKSGQQAGSQAVAGNRRIKADMAGIKRPSLVGTGLQIAGAGVSAYSDYKKSQAKATS